jgi:hypothetical protein
VRKKAKGYVPFDAPNLRRSKVPNKMSSAKAARTSHKAGQSGAQTQARQPKQVRRSSFAQPNATRRRRGGGSGSKVAAGGEPEYEYVEIVDMKPPLPPAATAAATAAAAVDPLHDAVATAAEASDDKVSAPLLCAEDLAEPSTPRSNQPPAAAAGAGHTPINQAQAMLLNLLSPIKSPFGERSTTPDDFRIILEAIPVRCNQVFLSLLSPAHGAVRPQHTTPQVAP